MPADFTVKAVMGEPNRWDAPKGGTILYYDLLVEGPGAPEEPVSIGVKEGGPYGEPQVGDTIYGSITSTDRGHKLKREQRERSSNGFSGDSKDEFARRSEHPDNAARMRHTAALSAAPAYIEQMLTLNVVKQPESKQEYVELVAGVVEWLEGTYPQSDQVVPWTVEPQGTSA